MDIPCQYEVYLGIHGVAATILDPTYNQIIFRRMRLRTDLGRQRDEVVGKTP
jgi:hypothetical protein